MLYSRNHLTVRSHVFLFFTLSAVVLVQVPWATSVVAPSSNCYAIDNSSRLVDFTDWIGHDFMYDGKDADLAVRFCKVVEQRSQKGYVDFGRYTSNYFLAGSGHVNFVQDFYEGDLMNCEHTVDKLGRTAEVYIVCGNCLNGACKGELGCICNVTYDNTICRVLVELAIPCEKPGPRVFEGFTVGFHPRSMELVYNGLTQFGFEKLGHAYSFGTEQTHVSLYLTAIASLSGLVGKLTLKINPDKGLEVKLSGSGANGSPPTTLSPTLLGVDWRCVTPRDTPYEVAISIPVEGYDPIEFVLTKKCEHKQGRQGDSLRGWATFGMLSCVLIVLSTLFCCGGFIYKAHVEHQCGLDALPGMTILSACLDAVTGSGDYSRMENLNSNSINQASWERPPASRQGTQRTDNGPI
ncbi:hypothetical protein QJS10_CPA01g01232 [Acorus calamus]|uniref:AT4G36440-like protein n=1 Tax=Acorus calamus TaxID=4465 RepID=A0AAV9FIG1_ACOCL|nr:hypothetical protein QJS10_CPA01g01232 [Acorus calamus]